MSKQSKAGETASRRDFLKLASTSVPAAAAAVALAPDAAEAATTDAAGEGLRDTAHTRAYLDSARF
ncbi:ubiquinol-cytochrome c reductase iron-sulfur subunit N-terminal domain-containing protein [Dinoroseobacter sp. S76]|uniref:ubiquinol-cytochrome c reductase iron-sulfur subunit N-terminal domain-containing protein n=1 Tax=Dinoroseobacter sp. S76 TaxID=3415124 RepID=UPI003C7DFCF5